MYTFVLRETCELRNIYYMVSTPLRVRLARRTLSGVRLTQ